VKLLERLKKKDRFAIRGVIAGTLGLVGVAVELFLHNPPDIVVVLLYLGLSGIGTLVIVTFKDPKLRE